eukprot:CAMPEP_0185178104 /NCGR_PEP_ID=MMETSP1139-20130426/30707_1 /TAXON_ID=298111 /ORGANISM="Pavlova sp., Strain CCMP459" /LENGTH=102 /DNA_ID=CAMNT_0027743915 /DNA_START=106 /DNA_END=415 /DNA_ORIENTATION=+
MIDAAAGSDQTARAAQSSLGERHAVSIALSTPAPTMPPPAAGVLAGCAPSPVPKRTGFVAHLAGCSPACSARHAPEAGMMSHSVCSKMVSALSMAWSMLKYL